jgi:hypothetical protein
MTEPNHTTERLNRWRQREVRPDFIRTLDTIEKHGWQAMLVSAKKQSHSFAYSIGLFDVFALPELITIGLPLDVAHGALNRAFQIMRTGVDLRIGRHRDVVGEVEVLFRPVSRRWYEETMYRTDWYYEEAEIPALQLIYPDLNNRFQWDEGFNEYFRQPLFQPDAMEGPTEHSFESGDEEEKNIGWKFPTDRHTNAFLSKTVFNKTETVVFVSHDRDGSWQFLGDSMHHGGGPIVSCLHHPVDDDPSLEDLHDLPIGWYAERREPGHPWKRYELPPEG